ncbi:hypothetical protein HOR86_gp138 [Escherichia phage OSYSP]|uniref:Uncharacterized protein n=4 Tax=Viruses TaxID=10239 RepID=A0A3P4A6U7_9CAUD|nr:hypothetical protein HOR86_gp138 [Escherichia phage OSYSP]YP_009824613.1 hypothetical protein HOV62_gp113 [Escherichia phage vB_Eco_mar004NP2]QXV84419.1 hypothetical protein bas34_0127 [Escherichia phage SelmaRatti]WCZ57622.1 hypothetical protein K20_030 [Salmonella phage Kenya-K20]WNT48477.1 hypothetical protein SPLA5b_PHROGS00156 [Salmonella phage SPLA5b]ASM62998.1 hypothetical protein OSY_138 [Escherichia phage OSYSP]VCU43494.1 hypothetical protein MAR004NP2_00100 [Escherichia phage vB_
MSKYIAEVIIKRIIQAIAILIIICIAIGTGLGILIESFIC